MWDYDSSTWPVSDAFNVYLIIHPCDWGPDFQIAGVYRFGLSHNYFIKNKYTVKLLFYHYTVL